MLLWNACTFIIYLVTFSYCQRFENVDLYIICKIAGILFVGLELAVYIVENLNPKNQTNGIAYLPPIICSIAVGLWAFSQSYQNYYPFEAHMMNFGFTIGFSVFLTKLAYAGQDHQKTDLEPMQVASLFQSVCLYIVLFNHVVVTVIMLIVALIYVFRIVLLENQSDAILAP